MSKKSNYRSVHKVIDQVVLNKAEEYGNTRAEIAPDTYRNNIQFNDWEASNVYVADGTLETLEDDPAVRAIGDIREVRFRNLDKYVEAL